MVVASGSTTHKKTLNELHLFAGAGGGILGGLLLGHRPICAVEIESAARRILLARQRDGSLPLFPIWDDVRTFDGRPWRGIADVVCGGFPCQDISAAGRGTGIDGERSGLWAEMRRVVGEVRPQFVFVENSPMLTFRGLGTVLGDLAGLGYDARWGIVSAADAGAPHLRERLWILADANGDVFGVEWQSDSEKQSRHPSRFSEKMPGNDWWFCERGLARMVDGLADQMDRLHAIGNGQVPAVAASAWKLLSAPARCYNNH